MTWQGNSALTTLLLSSELVRISRVSPCGTPKLLEEWPRLRILARAGLVLDGKSGIEE